MKFCLTTESLTVRKLRDYTGVATARTHAQTLADALRETTTLRFADVGVNPLVQADMSPGELKVESFEPEPLAPSLTSITPATGAAAGGTAVTIKGTGFVSGTTFTVGGNAVTSLIVVDPETATAVTPAHTAGATNLVVSVPTSSSPKTATMSNAFTYA